MTERARLRVWEDNAKQSHAVSGPWAPDLQAHPHVIFFVHCLTDVSLALKTVSVGERDHAWSCSFMQPSSEHRAGGGVHRYVRHESMKRWRRGVVAMS